MTRVDARGELCPLPLIKTKKAISVASKGDIIEVLSDNDTAKGNLLDYITELGFAPAYTLEEGVHRIIFTVDKGAETLAQTPAFNQEPTCPVPAPGKKNFTVVLKSLTMGNGERELGEILMRAYINSLPELDNKPNKIILYNEGVKLALEGADTADTLLELYNSGIEIIACGTCADYYQIKDKLKVGKISNMYVISTVISESDLVAYP